MVFLSRLIVNVGDNPDRPRPGRFWLRNIYHIHQRLSMAFPSRFQKEQDPFFLTPFNPQNFERPKFLFRIERGPDIVIIVQSEIEPDWDYAFKNAPELLKEKPEVEEVPYNYKKDQKIHFRLLANPSKRKPGRGKGRNRLGLFEREAQIAWLKRKGANGGFIIDESQLKIEPMGFQRCIKANLPNNQMTHYAVHFDGILTITDDELFYNTIRQGIGSGKGFGFGLLHLERTK